MSTRKSDTTEAADLSAAKQLVDDSPTGVPSRVNSRVAVTALEPDDQCDALEIDDEYDADCDPYNRTGQFCVEAVRRKSD